VKSTEQTAATLSMVVLAVDFIGFSGGAALQLNPMKSTAKSKMDKVESVCSVLFRLFRTLQSLA